MSYFIGLMIGSSLDSIDVVVVDITQDNINVINALEVELLPQLRSKLLNINAKFFLKLEDLLALERDLTMEMISAIEIIMSLVDIDISTIEAIGVHGYTCAHQPDVANSLQLVNANMLAAKFNTKVVADFRRLDMANGGQGAPLLPAFHYHLWKNHLNVAVLNIGGMANVTLLHKDSLLGFDTGPGNVLLDAWVRLKLNIDYDKNGAIARKGMVITDLLDSLKQHGFFHQPAPKSTSRDDFNLELLLKFVKDKYKVEDVQATLVELTAWSIALGVNNFAACDKIYVCGGGAFNAFLLERIKVHTNKAVCSVQDLGWSPVYLEATAFAWLAYRRVKNITTELKTVTGAIKNCVLGALYNGKGY